MTESQDRGPAWNTWALVGISMGCVMGAGFIAAGLALLLGAGSSTRAVPRSTGIPFLTVGLAIGIWCAALIVRTRRRRAESRTGRQHFTGASASGGRSVTVIVEGKTLVLERFEVRMWTAAIGGFAMAVHSGLLLRAMATGGGVATAVPIWIWFIPFGPFLQRRSRQSFPIDAFGAMEVVDKTVRLHRRGARTAPLEIALKSWSVPRLAEALRAEHAEGFSAEPPDVVPAPRDELAEARAALRAWMPPQHAASTTMIGLSLVAASLFVGLFAQLDPGSRTTAGAAIGLWGGAALLWLTSRGAAAQRDAASARLSDAPVGPITGHVRRDASDPMAWIAPWVAMEIDVRHERLLVTRRPRDAFEAVVLAGVAVVGGWLVLGSWAPLWSAMYALPLMTSGYPRRRTDESMFLPEQVLAFEDEGTRGSLRLRDEDGEQTLLLRYDSKNGRRLVALLHESCPGARVREPGWRRP